MRGLTLALLLILAAISHAPQSARAGAAGACDANLVELAKLTASDAAESDNFGISVSLSGNTALIGAWGDDDGSAESGSAYVFRASEGVWQQIAKLTAVDAAESDGFGVSGSLSGDTAVIGALWDDDGGSQSGSAYVFRDLGGVWQQIAKLTAADAAAGDTFGYNVSLSGDTAVIGAYGDDDGGTSSGSAYVFREIGGVWQQIAKLTAADAAAGDYFGRNVSLSGGTAVVGAHQDDAGGSGSGSAYVFRELGGVWQQIAKLTAADAAAGDIFGYSVSLSGDTAVIGAYADDDGGADKGAAYVFREVGGVWQQIAKLTAADGAAADYFGWSVSLSGDTAVVGAIWDDDGGFSSGSAYVFREQGGVWQQIAKPTASDAAAGAVFGVSVSLSGDTAMIGAYNDGGAQTGSAYVFDMSLVGNDCNSNGMLDACELGRLVGVSIPANSMDSSCYPYSSGVWGVSAEPGVDLNVVSGIGYLVNPAPAADLSLHDHQYAGPYVPQPGRAEITYQFSIPVVVDQIEVIQHTNGITQIQGFVGDSTASLTSIGTVFGPRGDVTGWGAFPEGESNVFDFDNHLAGRFFRLVIRKTSLVDGYASYQVFPRSSFGQRFDGQARECNDNGVPDECEPDCNTNGVADDCDVAPGGGSQDCAGDGVPDECESGDCNLNGTFDDCDIAAAPSSDCNTNGTPDDCDIAAWTSDDCDTNGVPDECEFAFGARAKLTASDAAAGDNFGFSVSVSGVTTVIGAWGDDDRGSASGSAYVFRASGGTGQQIAKLIPSDAAAGDQFGTGVSLSGDTAVVGANAGDAGVVNSGSAYVFRELGGVWQQIAKLTAADAALADAFGWRVSLSGGTAVIGAYGDDDRGTFSGSAYVFRELGGVWQQIAKLTAADAAANDQFGWSVSIDGDTAVIGASGDDDGGSGSGSAYVFREVGGVWQQIAKLTASDTAVGDDFGNSISVSGATAVIGARLDDDGGFQSGSAYVFREVGGVWQQIAKLTASDAAAADNFGWSVSINGDTAVIGASGDDDGASGSGSAYVFREVGGVWQQMAKLNAADAAVSENFGNSVAISGDTAVIGAYLDDDGGAQSGSVYVFDLSLIGNDCNSNGIPDECDIASGVDGDCNFNDMPDACDIAAGTSQDLDVNGWPDECDVPCDFDDDGDVDADTVDADYTHLLDCFTGPNVLQLATACVDARLDGDFDVDLIDFAVFQGCTSGAGVPGDPNCASEFTFVFPALSVGTDPICVAPGQRASIPISLGAPAPGPVVISLTSSDESIAIVTPTILVPFGSQMPEQVAMVTGVDFGAAEISVTIPGFQRVVPVTVALGLSFAPASLVIGEGVEVDVTISLSKPAPPTGLVLALSGYDPAVATISPSSLVTVPPNKASVRLTVSGIAAGTTTLIVGPADPDSELVGAQLPITVLANAISMTPSEFTLGRNLQSCLSISLSSPAPAGSLEVTLSSSDSSAMRLSLSPDDAAMPELVLIVPAGSTDMPHVFVHGLSDQGTVTVTASDTRSGVTLEDRYSGTMSTITLSPSGFVFADGDFSTTFPGFGRLLSVVPTPLDAGTLMPIASETCDPIAFPRQMIRSGLSVQVPVDSSNEAVGASTSPAFFRAGDATSLGQFVPAGLGTTELCLEMPDGFTMASTNGCITATVIPGGTILLTDVTVGRNLQKGFQFVQLPSVPLQPIDVTITSMDDTIAKVSRDAHAVGQSSVTFTNVQFTSFVGPFYVQGLEIGQTVLSASASDPVAFPAGTASVDVVRAGFIINPSFLPASLCPGGTRFTVQPSSLDVNTRIPIFEFGVSVMAGADVTVELDDIPSVGGIDPTSAVFAGGESAVSLTYTPLVVGQTTVSVNTPTVPAGFDTPASRTTMTVVAQQPAIGFSAMQVGLDLQARFDVVLPCAPNPDDPLEVTVTSSDPSRVTLSPDLTSIGQTSLTFNNVTTMEVGSIYVQGLSLGMAAGVLTIDAPGSGFLPGNVSVEVVPSGFVHCRGDFEVTTFADEWPLIVLTAPLHPVTLEPLPAPPDASCDHLGQAVRAGLEVQVSLISSDPAVGTVADPVLTFFGGTGSASTTFQPHIVGSTDLVLGAGEFHAPASGGTITATVRAPRVIPNVSELILGLNLQVPLEIRLEDPPPTPVDVVVTVPSVLCTSISTDRTLAGGAAVTFPGVTSRDVGTIYVHGISLKDIHLVITASGYEEARIPVLLRPSGFVFSSPRVTALELGAFGPDESLSVALAPLDPITLNPISVLSNDPTAFITQSIRGSFEATAILASSNESTVLPAPTVLTFGAGTGSVGTTIAPVNSGTGTVTLMPAAGSEAFDVPSIFSRIDVAVLPPILLDDFSVGVGQEVDVTVTLSEPPTPSVDVTVEIAETAIAAFDFQGPSVGPLAITFAGVTGNTVGPIAIRGRLSGTTNMTVTAPGYATRQVTITVNGP